MFISFLYMFGRLCAYHQEKNCTYATNGICHSVWMTDWYTVWNETRVTETNCRIDTVLSPDYEQIIPRNIYRKEINIIKKKCAPISLYLQGQSFVRT